MDAVRLFTRGQVLPAFLPARSETVGRIGPFSRTCLRHLTFRGSGKNLDPLFTKMHHYE